jgi:DNA-binding MarR family transcriptional regulator
LEIAREPGLTQNGLAARLRLEKSTVSRIAGMLEGRGWIRRVRDERDSRFVRLHLTKRGMTANANIAESRRAKFDRIFDALPADRRGSILEALSLLLEVTRET